MGSGLWPGLPLPTPNEPDPVDLAQVQVRMCVGFAGHLNAPYDGGQRMVRVATSEGSHSRLEGMLHLKNNATATVWATRNYIEVYGVWEVGVKIWRVFTLSMNDSVNPSLPQFSLLIFLKYGARWWSLLPFAWLSRTRVFLLEREVLKRVCFFLLHVWLRCFLWWCCGRVAQFRKFSLTSLGCLAQPISSGAAGSREEILNR